MDEPLEAVAFLARSENRVAVLRALDERARDRRELETATGASRSTLGRVLGELEDRRWIERDGRRYETTRAGELVFDRFVDLLETIGGICTLGDAIGYLPLDDMSLDVRHFADATVVPATELRPTRPYDYAIDELRAADRFRCVARSVPPVYVRAIHEAITSGELDVTCVLDREYLDSIRDDEVLTRWRDVAASGATVARHEGTVPYVVIVLDRTVHLWLYEDAGGRHSTVGLLESDDPAVLAWAEATVADYVEAARPLETTAEA